MADNPKPTDFLERFADRDFADTSSVDVATVPSKSNPDDMLFGKDGKAPEGDGEPQDDTFIWDESDKVVEKYGQGMWRTDVIDGNRVQRYFGKTRTEVTKQLKQAQVNATRKIAEQQAKLTAIPKQAPVPDNLPPLTPDTKLPYDPIPRRSPRKLTAQEIMQLQELEQIDPLEAQRIKFEAATGYTFEAFGEAVNRSDSMYARRIADEAAFQFQANHAEANDWETNRANTDALDKFLKDRAWPVTVNNLEIAFRELKRQGKLTMPAPEEEEIVAPPAPPPEIEDFTPPPPPVSLPSGTSQSRVAKPEADLLREAAAGIRDMPLAEAREQLTQAFRRQRGTR